ncbi:DNA-directed RNA polymerase I subunit RPA1-like, partial [Tropilaelaps mercedesae]
EVTSVFAVYGIKVDPRHLSLVADYMTFDGAYRAFNRIHMANNASPLQQMSFETTCTFMKNAALLGFADRLNSPSARLVMGQLVGVGTGICEILGNIPRRGNNKYAI